MERISSIGTARYDWRRCADGTAEATLWFVVFFFPIIPLRRERLRVIDSRIKGSGDLGTLGTLVGVGASHQTSIQFLGTRPLSPLPVLRTYFMGFVVVPLLTTGLPLMLMIGTAMALGSFGMDANAVLKKMVPIVGIATLLWSGCVVARILDRSAGRCHVSPISDVTEPSDETEQQFTRDFRS